MSEVTELREIYNELAHRADTRLLALERQATKEGYGDILNYAYKGAMYDIAQIRGTGRKRFRTGDVKTWDIRHLRSNINKVRDFLEAESSTISNVKAIENKRWKSFNESTGMNLTKSEFYRFVQSKEFEKLKDLYGSSQVGRSYRYVKDIKRLRRNAKQWATRHEETAEHARDRAIQQFLEQNPDASLTDYSIVEKIIEDIPSIDKYWKGNT